MLAPSFMPAPRLSLFRKLLYGLLTAAVLLGLFVGGAEFILRLTGVGHSPQFVRSATTPEGEAILRENRWATAPYFGERRVRRPWPLRLPAEKPAGSYRVFVLGSSAAMGDPEPSFSLARMLEHMLTAAYPETRFEVVNAAVTAINSHVLRGIAADCAELQPDLFIVYEGHNEVIGPFGPAGVFAGFRRSPLALRGADLLQRSRLGQAVRGALAPEADDERWAGMQMFLDQQIAAEDPRLGAVADHFRANLRAIVDAGRQAGATTLLCTVLTNQRDFAPFMSQHRADLGETEAARWQELYLAGDTELAAENPRAAERAYRAAWAIDDRHAELAFKLGRLALQRGDRPEAARLLQRALDLDTLRFRTDSTLNQAIVDAAGGSAAKLIDIAGLVGAQAEFGIPGDDLLYEHVHLNFHGTYLVARALFPRIAEDLVSRGLSTRYVGEPFTESEARRRLGYNAHEQTMIALELVNRFEAPPFTGQSDNAQRLFAWSERAERGQQLLAAPQTLVALKQGAAQTLQLAPGDWVLQRNTGAMLVARGDAMTAKPLLQKAAGWIDDDVDTLMALALAHDMLGEATEAEETYARVRELEPNYPGLPKRTD